MIDARYVLLFALALALAWLVYARPQLGLAVTIALAAVGVGYSVLFGAPPL